MPEPRFETPSFETPRFEMSPVSAATLASTPVSLAPLASESLSALAEAGLVSASWVWDWITSSPPEVSPSGVMPLGGVPLCMVDCRFNLMDPAAGRHQYEAGHIPGAVYLDLNQELSSLPQRHGGRHPLPESDRLVQRLSQLGIGPTTLVVAYDASRFAFAARLWWLLRYLGHPAVVLLDGGWTGWLEQGYAVTSEIPQRSAADFVAQIQGDWVVDIAQVHGRSAQMQLVDAREGDRYRGEREPIDPVAGHIPGALNRCWQEVTDASGYALAPELQRQRWVGLDSAPIIHYCGSGVTACVNLWSRHRAGLPLGQLYAGSWSDWCSYDSALELAP